MKLNNMIIGVLTGDVVESSTGSRSELLTNLKEVFKKINALQPQLDLSFELYRGDSFQGIILKPEDALKYSLLIRTSLKSKDSPGGRDARIAIGLGKVDFIADSISTSDGEAFRNSGPILDTLKAEDIGLKIRTPWKQINEEFDVSLFLADAIIKRWTVAQAEVISESLMGKTQGDIATQLGITQSAVNQRLKAASWEAINELIRRYNTVIKAATQELSI